MNRCNCLKNLSNYIEQNSTISKIGNAGDSWIILNPIEQSIKDKIEQYGTPLKNWNIEINYGIKTGCNEAFIIDEDTKDKLIAEDPKSAEIIRPILRGKDIKKYSYNFANLYLINTHNGLKDKGISPIDVNNYPAIKKHFLQYGKERLEQTGETHIINGQKIKSRKKTNNKWYETQDSIAYWDDFFEQKIIYSETNNVNTTKIAFDTNGYFTDKTCFIIISKEFDIEKIYKILSSEIFTWYMKHKSPLLGTAGISLTKELVETFPCANYDGKSAKSSYNLTDVEMAYINKDLNKL